ncbi:cadherin-23-like isoform X3 [Dendronephthya gigantea]|uniref:cadherin-23-like isoform X3 n=1 Tax=Dendronephthya gigantea TaxID=151771 RepID=UPI00106C1667|nr:cadherin-23-like isoform X3 [Dendronephthya gigantea]
MAGSTAMLVLPLISLFQFTTGQVNQIPRFQDLPHGFTVDENAKAGTLVANLTAVDHEGQKVTMLLDGVGQDLFIIVDQYGNKNDTGLSPLTRYLLLKKELDREARDSYVFKLSVKDYFADSGRESKRHMSLSVRDVNDNSPVFLKTPYITSIKENTASDNLWKVEADDADTSINGYVNYYFTEECEKTDCEPFEIDALSGEVKLKTNRTLDYEKRNRYNLDILAKDNGKLVSLNSTTTLVVKVEDESDQPPEFEKSSYRKDIDENEAVGTEVIKTTAFDGDRGIDKPVKYAIVQGDNSHYFKIGNSTGTIYVDSIIDRDIGIDFFELTVEATEIPGNATGNTTVFITIQDLNDNKPEFRTEGFTYTASIPEDTPKGTTIFFQMGAEDKDREAKNAKFQYSLSGDTDHVFRIDPRIGRIELNKTVDFEMKQQYTFMVIASETDSVEKFSANQTIIVNITNINDYDPKFNESQYNLTVAEGAKIGAELGRIRAYDEDDGIFGVITYSLSGNGAEKFSVDKNNGTISVASELDFESKESYSIRLEAKDGGNKITEVSVIIVITDDNDNVPIFDPPGVTTATLDENKSGGFFVVVKATDADIGANGEIKYSITGGDPLKNFTIDTVTGNITNTGPLDFETQSEFTLVVMAMDQGTPSLNTTKVVKITIKDKNDNPPYFNQTSFTVSLLENTDIDYPIVQLHAFDKDTGANAELVYSIVSGNTRKMFSVNAEGLVLTRSSPDRESQSVYTLNVSVSDSGDPKMFAYAMVIVNILDENDNSPKFEITVDKKKIEEGATTLNTTVANNSASDNDLGLNGTMEYTIADGNSEGKFTMDPQTGVVTVAQELDFETVRIYSLKIVASDKGTPPLSGEYQLVVEVLDINDNRPEFGQPEYSFTVTENRKAGTSIVRLSANDRDSEENKKITYSFSHGNLGSAFTINNETGEISTTKELDRENVSAYFLTVKAKDHGNPSLEGTTNITITVLDENDEQPVFKNAAYNITVAEDTAKGTSVYTVTATDADEGPAGQVSYQMQQQGNLENGNAVFSVGSISGEVKTAISLDFEKHHTFTITVTAWDNGFPKQSSNVTLYITISDTDDNPPVFTQKSWSARVNENAVPNDTIIQVNATDIDFETAHRKIYYVITSGNDDGVFGIGYESGIVNVANTTNLDRETKDEYELTIEARTLNKFKNDTVQRTATELTIQVDDYNDYAPVFRESSYSKKIPESFELNEEILTVTADDKDIGKNSDISYSIVAGNDEGVFAINETTGVMTVAKRLDRESVHTHSLVVSAKDHGTPSLSSNATVKIDVSDTNDENPVLIVDRTIFEIMENATNGTVVAKFNATDADLGKNAKIGYRIVSGNSDGVFDINNQTGELFIVKGLNHESVQQYKIGIQAYDNGVPSLQSNIKVITINVQDTNDNLPFFPEKSVSLSVLENENSGSKVGSIKASDADASALFYYYIIGGTGADVFALDEESGEVTTKKVLDRERNSTYYIYVAVFNSKQTPEYIATLKPPEGSRRKRSVVENNIQLVTITISDTNDNEPYFKENFYKAGVSENAEYNSRITQITCIDKDAGNNSKLIYKAVDLQPAELLTVEPETGWILAGQQQYFASGVGKKYSFVYSCEDSKTVAKTNVTIFVLVDDQRVRLTLGINDTKFVRDNIDEIKKALDEATGLEFNVDSIQYHLQSNGRYDLSKTDIFMHAVDPKTNKVVSKDTAINLIDTNYGKLIALFQKYKVNAVEPKKPDSEGEGFDAILAAAIVLAVILFIILLCFLCVICLMRRSHNRKLRAAKAIGSQDQTYGVATPGTNLHVFEGSNPVWMDPYDNWRSEDDKNSSAKIYEAQEVSMDMFRDGTPDARVMPGTFYESSYNGAAYHPNGILNLTMPEDDKDEVTDI